MADQKQIIEVNGVKMEVDLRHAKVIDEYKVGSRIKVLHKDYTTWKSSLGVIIGFDQFKKLPTILIAYVESDYNSAQIKFLSYNEKTEDVELTQMHESDEMDRGGMLDSLDREITKKAAELQDLQDKKEYFLKHFDKNFETEQQKCQS